MSNTVYTYFAQYISACVQHWYEIDFSESTFNFDDVWSIQKDVNVGKARQSPKQFYSRHTAYKGIVFIVVYCTSTMLVQTTDASALFAAVELHNYTPA